MHNERILCCWVFPHLPNTAILVVIKCKASARPNASKFYSIAFACDPFVLPLPFFCFMFNYESMAPKLLSRISLRKVINWGFSCNASSQTMWQLRGDFYDAGSLIYFTNQLIRTLKAILHFRQVSHYEGDA